MPFNSTGPHYCPNCPPVYRFPKKIHPRDEKNVVMIEGRSGVRCGVQLELGEDNYSGCGVDIAFCPECKKAFQVSYKVDTITEVNMGHNP